jgi:polyhydroxyalkanoate synthesis repressor PhaR
MASQRRGTAAAGRADEAGKAAAASSSPASSSTSTPAEEIGADGGSNGGAEGAGPLRVLKKYPNRRLYDTRSSSYITLADVKKMVLAGENFVVRDARSSQDLTRSILLQIILEEETGGMPLFSAQMLAQLIRFHGDAMQGMMGNYLEKNLQTLADVQGRLAQQFAGIYGPRAVTPELWTQYMNGQAPVMQGLMGSYLDQSRKLFTQMQEQMTEQAEAVFPGMPVVPGMPTFKPPRR